MSDPPAARHGPTVESSADDVDSDAAERQVAASDLIGELEARAVGAEDRWRRAAADFDNLQKRFQREVARERGLERERVTGQWVAMIDDLERAMAHAGQSAGGAALVDGVQAIISNAIAAIADLGYPRFGAPGERFDAGLHEVVTTVPPDDELGADTIAAVIKPGYGTRENLLRPASVAVAADPQ